jgi:hypothetical protein
MTMMHRHSFAHPDEGRHTDHVHGAPNAHDIGGHALGALCAGVLAWNSWRCVSRTHRLRVQGRSACVPEPLQTWEGEGGRPDAPSSISRGDPASVA